MKYFITATGTGIGKTLVTTSLCWQLREQGISVTALKPVISGYDPHDLSNDSAQIVASLGHAPTPAAQEKISPWRYRAPLAPNMAASQEGNPIKLETLVDFCRGFPAITLVEGVGGVMVPLNDTHTTLDWMAALEWNILLVTGSYLGAISHTLTAVETLASRRLAPHAVIICESENGVNLDDTARTLEKFLPRAIPIVNIPRLVTTEPIWKTTPPIGFLCQKSRT